MFWKLLIFTRHGNEQTLKYQNFISAQNFPGDPKNTRIRIFYPKNTTSIIYHLAMEVPPGAKMNYSYAEALLFV